MWATRKIAGQKQKEPYQIDALFRKLSRRGIKFAKVNLPSKLAGVWASAYVIYYFTLRANWKAQWKKKKNKKAIPNTN